MFKKSAGIRSFTGFAKYTVKFFKELRHEGKPCFYPVGGIEVATTQERWQDLKRKHGFAAAANLEAHLISPAEVKALIPVINDGIIYGGFYVPSDGDARAVQAAAAMAGAAQVEGAAKFYGGIPVTDIEFEIEKNRLTAVVTAKGRIKTETVLLCTNIWAPLLARKVGVHVPLMAVEHLYAITTPLQEPTSISSISVGAAEPPSPGSHSTIPKTQS